MLCLSRTAGQRIKIGDNIVIVITEIRGDKVRIAIEAPKDVLILRDDVTQGAAEHLRDAAAYHADEQEATHVPNP